VIPTGVPEIDRAFGGGLPPGVTVIEDASGGASTLFDQAHRAVMYSFDMNSIRALYQTGCTFLAVDTTDPQLAVPANLNMLCAFMRDERPTCALVLVVDRVESHLLRIADVVITVSGSRWDVIKSRALGTIKASKFEVVPRPVVPSTTRIPTGLVALDAALGGGLPHGIAVMRGNRANIARVRLAMSGVLEGHYRPMFWHGDSINQLADPVGTGIASHAHRAMQILDFGDLTKKFPFDPVQVRGAMLAASEVTVSSIKPVCVLIEAHINREADAVLTDVADVVLKATDEGPWYVQKPYGGQVVAFEAAEKFDPLEVPKTKPPMTPERVLNALSADPNLFIEVAKRMKVARPWVAVGDSWFSRSEVLFNFTVLTVRKEQGGWLWSFFVPRGSEEQEVQSGGYVQTAEEARNGGDAWLRSQGWFVFD